MSTKYMAWNHQSSGQKRAYHHKLIFTVLLILLSTTYVFDRTTRSPVFQGIIRSNGFQHPLIEQDFVSEAIQSTLDPYNPTPVSQYCTHNSWNTNQAISCGGAFGGIGHTKQMILGCLHYAMRSGMGFIIPPTSLRSSDDSSSIQSIRETPFNHIFNQELFVSRLSASCPNMPIHNDVESATKQAVEIFHFSALSDPMNICDDGPGFATNFGSLLTFPTQIHHLAFSALHKFSIQQNLSINSSTLFSRSSFIGVHFQTSSDVIRAGWGSTSYEKQSKHYLSLARTLNFPVIYASGNPLSVFQFVAEAAALPLPIKVIFKENLLSGNELEELRSLSWDQAELVDHVLLQSAGFFAGLHGSSFSWSVAMARAKSRGGEEGVCGDRGEVMREGKWWKDNWSMIIGDCPLDFSVRTWP